LSVVREVNKRIETFARKILEKKLYFFPLSTTYFNMLFNPLLSYNIDSATEDAKDASGLDDAFTAYAENYIKIHFLTIQEFSIFYAENQRLGKRLVVTLSEKEEEAKKSLEKRGYKIEQESI